MKVIYVLYLVGLLFEITLLVGVVMAYVNRANAPETLRTHYQFQIRTFWIGLLYAVVSIILVLTIIGIFMLIFVLIWYLVRCIKGLQTASAGRPVTKPTSWMFG